MNRLCQWYYNWIDRILEGVLVMCCIGYIISMLFVLRIIWKIHHD